MDEDRYALVEKIIKDVDNIMSKNTELSSFDIVPLERNLQNKSPVLHEENCLGLESWCIKHVYMYCYSEVFDKYISQSKKKYLKVSVANASRLTKLLTMTLLINPDLSSMWNKRRELIERCLLDKARELKFTTLVLSRKPKCNEALAYRRWILEKLFENESIENAVLENLVSDELSICEQTADKSPNNYHSWNHRMWLINKLKHIKSYNIKLQYIKEYDFSQHWAARHISDHSCFHYRQFCIKNICNITNAVLWKSIQDVANINLHDAFLNIIAVHYPKDRTVSASELVSYSQENLITFLLGADFKPCCCRNNLLICQQIEILFNELLLNNELIKFYEHHETLWYHRRFIVHEIIELMYGYFSLVRQNGGLVKVLCGCQPELKPQAKIVRYDSNCVYSSVLFNVLQSHEQMFVNERRSAGDNYGDRHEKYLKFVKSF